MPPRHGGFASSFRSSFSNANKTQRQEKQTGAQAAGEGAERLGRFGSAMKDKKDGTDAVTRLQNYAKAEGERQKKAAAEKKKKEQEAASKRVEPQKGFVQRMMDKYWYKKEEK